MIWIIEKGQRLLLRYCDYTNEYRTAADKRAPWRILLGALYRLRANEHCLAKAR